MFSVQLGWELRSEDAELALVASGLSSTLVLIQNSGWWRKRDFLMTHTMCGPPCFLSEIQVCVHSLWSKDVEL